MFAYSSNILKANVGFDLMDSMSTSGTLKWARFSCKSFSLRESAPPMKLLLITTLGGGQESVLTSTLWTRIDLLLRVLPV